MSFNLLLLVLLVKKLIFFLKVAENIYKTNVILFSICFLSSKQNSRP